MVSLCATIPSNIANLIFFFSYFFNLHTSFSDFVFVYSVRFVPYLQSFIRINHSHNLNRIGTGTKTARVCEIFSLPFFIVSVKLIAIHRFFLGVFYHKLNPSSRHPLNFPSFMTRKNKFFYDGSRENQQEKYFLLTAEN